MRTLTLLAVLACACGPDLASDPATGTQRSAVNNQPTATLAGTVTLEGSITVVDGHSCYTDLDDLYRDGAVALQSFCGRAGGRIYPELDGAHGCYQASVVCYNTGFQSYY